MIRKLKNYLHKDNASLQSYDLNSLEPTESNFQRHNEAEVSSSPVSFIKRKIRSSKSWVKMPKAPRIFRENESIYATVSPELASQEFEQFTRNFNTNTVSSIDYGFGSQAPSLNLHSPMPSSIVKIEENRLQKHSTLDNKNTKRNFQRNYSNSCCGESSHYKINDRENFFYFKVIQRLKKSSIMIPANIPVLCVRSFKSNTPRWNHVIQQFNLMHKNDVKLIEINRGVPVNAQFYQSDLDLIYVRTADEIEGYVPRDHCKPVMSSEVKNDQSNQSKNQSTNCSSYTTTDTNETNDRNTDNSIKYHSLSLSTEYENINLDDGENPYSNIVNNTDSESSIQEKANCRFESYCNNQDNVKSAQPTTWLTRDSGYRSDVENGAHLSNQLVNDYDMNGDCVMGEIKEENIDKCLANLQSRSRVPISIRSNLNLTVMHDQDNNKPEPTVTFFNNPSYNSPAYQPSIQSPTNFKPFERNKIRRSLDSNMILGSKKPTFHTVDIEIDDTAPNYNQTLNLFKKREILSQLQQQNKPYPDLDVNKIELDSINEKSDVPENVINKVKKLWTVINSHEAKTGQEVSVRPGMLVLVIRQYENSLYVKLVETEPNGAQLYGYIPRNCAIDLQEVIQKTKSTDVSCNNKVPKPRRSQITAL